MKLLILFFLIFYSTTLKGRVWDLVSIVETANRTSEKIKQSNAEAHAIREDRQASRSLFLPSFDINTKWDRAKETLSRSQDDKVSNNLYRGILRQRLFSPKSMYLMNTNTAKSESFNLKVKNQVYSFQADTVQLYLDLLHLESLMNQLNHSYETIEKEKHQTTRKVRSGILTRTAVDELGVRLAEIALKRNDTARKLDILILVLQERLGQRFQEIKPLRKGFEISSIVTPSFEEDLAKLHQSNPKVIQAASDVRLRKAEAQEEKSEILPEVAGFVELSHISSDSLQDSKQISAGIELKWSILSGGSSFHKTAAAKKREVAAGHRYRESLKEEKLHLRTAVAHINRCKSHVEFLQEKSKYLNNMVIAEYKRHKGGVGEFSNYIKKKAELQDSQLEITVEKFDCLSAYIKYVRHSGNLGMQKIKDINQAWFE